MMLHRFGTTAFTFSLLLAGLFIFTAWKAVDESPTFSENSVKDNLVRQYNKNIPLGLGEVDTEPYLLAKKTGTSNDCNGALILEEHQPLLSLMFFARTFSPSSAVLLQYSDITPYVLDMRIVNKNQTSQDFEKVNGNPWLFGDHQNSEDGGVSDDKGLRALQQGDLTPPAWLSASYADRSSSTMKVDLIGRDNDHTIGSSTSQTLRQDRQVNLDQQKYGSGLDTIPPPKQTDTLIIDLGQGDVADPGDRIRYRVTIENTGINDATGTQLNIVPDPRTTFAPGSFRSSPLAVNDLYTSTGNVGISVSAINGLKANDFDDDLSGASVTAGTFATTGGGSIMINADGSFMYTPPVGFTGSDTYTYTLNDGNGVGNGVPSVDMATVTIAVNDLIWFIDNSSVAGVEDGRLNTPFKTIANFSASALPAAGAVIFIKNTGSEYRGGFILKNNQSLFGSGYSGGSNLSSVGVLPFMVATHSFALPAINIARPLIRNMGTGGSGNGIGIVLASGNTIRGVEIGRCEIVKISGAAFGTLTIGNTTSPDVALSGNQNVLGLTNGIFATTSKFVSINSPDSSGLLLNTVSGSLASTSTLIGASGSGSFGIDIQSSSASLDFGTTTVSNFNFGPAISITSSGTGSATFGSLTITSGSAGLFTNMGGTIHIGGTGSTITGRPALDITNTSFGTGATFATITSASSAGKGVNLDNVSGPIVISGGSITSSTSIAFDINAGSSTVTYAGTISNANRAVEVTGRTGGTVTFSGNITNTGTGINVGSNTGGTIAFSGMSKSLNTGANPAVTLATNPGRPSTLLVAGWSSAPLPAWVLMPRAAV
ncbi:MAG: cadherin-like domain-containing protein [Saprospiraceae bacterium]|nr:cadherin-like domain-containing protein [Saprospiraceae bacterium]